MGLTEQEKSVLAKLQKKAEEPDAPPVGKSIRANIDLSDENQVKRAIRFGFLTSDEADELMDENGDGDDGKGGDDTPKRKGYFENE